MGKHENNSHDNIADTTSTRTCTEDKKNEAKTITQNDDEDSITNNDSPQTTPLTMKSMTPLRHCFE